MTVLDRNSAFKIKGVKVQGGYAGVYFTVTSGAYYHECHMTLLKGECVEPTLDREPGVVAFAQRVVIRGVWKCCVSGSAAHEVQQ